MKSNISMIEAIKNRTSIRTYLGKPLTPREKESFLEFIGQQKSIFEPSVRFGFVDQNPQEALKLGTYGVIKNASSFVVAAVKSTDYNMEELGYKLEKGILFATSQGFGTCWLGGTFNRSDFGKALSLNDSEHIPAITPIGLPTEKRRFIDKTMRTLVGATKRKQWDELFFNNNFKTPLQETQSDLYTQVLEMVRMGPSASNKQPWRIVRNKEGFHFYLAHSKHYPVTAQRMDMGIAMCHFESTALELGLTGAFSIKDPGITIPDFVTYSFSWFF